MKPLAQWALAAAGLVFMNHAAPMQAQELAAAALFEQSASALTKPVLGGGVGGGEGGVEGNAFLLQPLWSTLDRTHGGSLLFLQPEVVWRDEGQWFGGLGLGFRHWFEGPVAPEKKTSPLALFLADGWFIGGSVFVDVAQSPNEQTFWQMSGALEMGTRYVTLRANCYWPLTDEQRYGQTHAVDLRESRAVSSSERTDYRIQVAPTPSGPFNGPFGPYFVTDIRAFATTNRSSSLMRTLFQTTRTFGLYEEALEGWDLEASLLVPGLDRFTDLRLLAGFYAFGGGQFSKDIEGWRLGCEWRPVPALVLTGTWYEDSRMRGSDWFTGIGFEIPLGTPWKELCRVHTRTLKERMVEPVRRQRQITLASGSKLERIEVRAVNLQSSGGRSIITIDSGPLIFHNGLPRVGDEVWVFGQKFIVQANGTLKLGTYGPFFVEGFGLFHFADGYDPDGPHPTGLLVPEPSRTLLLVMGVALLMLRRKRTTDR